MINIKGILILVVMAGLLLSCQEKSDNQADKDGIASPPPLEELPPSDYEPINDRPYSSVDEVIASLYAVISGPAGPRDWDKMRELCLPTAGFSSFAQAEDGTVGFRQGSIDSYIENSGKFFLQSGFYETEIGRHVDKFGHIAHVFSAYQSTFEKAGEVKARGINSIQLVQQEGRWYIANVIWDAETDSEKIPIEYLKE